MPFVAQFSWPQLLQATSGEAGKNKTLADDTLCRVWTDTRTLAPGDFFLPIIGARFDGHDYVEKALSEGAAGAFVQADKFAQHPEWANLANLIIVPDTLIAYLQIAQFHRERMPAKVIGIAGSNGKTTTKEMMAAALSAVGKTQQTFKNHNNEIGVSQTLLAIEPDTQFMVVEMAMRGPGEIGLLSRHAKPDVALVLNIGPEHIEFFGTLNAIAHAECEIFEGLNLEKGIGLISADDDLLPKIAPTHWQGKLEKFSLSDAQSIALQPEGGTHFLYQDQPIFINATGRHNVSNALAVLKTGQLLGCDLNLLIKGLSQFEPVEGRGSCTSLPGFENTWVINDAYNANPASMKASIQAFLEVPNPEMKRFIILGAMKELGPLSKQYHEKLGMWLSELSGIDGLYAYGEEGQWLTDAMEDADFPVIWMDAREAMVDCIAALGPELNNSYILLKGSRECQLETIPDTLSKVNV